MAKKNKPVVRATPTLQEKIRYAEIELSASKRHLLEKLEYNIILIESGARDIRRHLSDETSSLEDKVVWSVNSMENMTRNLMYSQLIRYMANYATSKEELRDLQDEQNKVQ